MPIQIFSSLSYTPEGLLGLSDHQAFLYKQDMEEQSKHNKQDWTEKVGNQVNDVTTLEEVHIDMIPESGRRSSPRLRESQLVNLLQIAGIQTDETISEVINSHSSSYCSTVLSDKELNFF